MRYIEKMSFITRNVINHFRKFQLDHLSFFFSCKIADPNFLQSLLVTVSFDTVLTISVAVSFRINRGRFSCRIPYIIQNK